MTAQRHRARAEVPLNSGYALAVLAPARDIAVRALPLTGAVAIGRAEDATVRIPDQSVASAHAIVHVGDGLSLEDLGTVGGTYVDDCRVERGRPVRLGPGSQVRLGGVDLVVQYRADGGAGRALASLADLRERIAAACVGAPAPHRSVAVARFRSRGGATDALARALAISVGERDLICELAADDCVALLVGVDRTGAETVTRRVVECVARLGGSVETELVPSCAGGSTADALLARVGASAVPTVPTEPRGIGVLRSAVAAVAAASVHAVVRGGPGAGAVAIAQSIHAASVHAVIPMVYASGDSVPSIDRGTLCVTELEQLAPARQRQLARMLDRAHVTGDRAVRIIATTSGGLELAVAQGRVRRDLYRRVSGAVLDVPSPAAPVATRPLLPTRVEPMRRTIERECSALERKLIVEALDRCGGNQTRAAQLLGMSRRALVNRLDRYAIPRPRKRVA